MPFSVFAIKAVVKKGTFVSSPVAPSLERDADAYELGIADIYIAKGTVSISQANISDIRLNTNLCGIVSSLIRVDTTTLLNQYEAGMREKETEFEQQFTTWFQTIQNTLSGDVAANLLNIITTHSSDKSNPHQVTAAQVGAETPAGAQAKANAVQTSLDAHKNDIANKTDETKGATIIGMKPITGLTGDNVRSAIQNLFQYANDGKTNIAGVIGSPALSSDTFTQLKDKIQAQKNTLAANLTVKGQVSSNTESLSSLAVKVGNISTQKIATGIATASNFYMHLNINNLSFKPVRIFAYIRTNNYSGGYICGVVGYGSYGNFGVHCEEEAYGYSKGGGADINLVTFNDTGFTADVGAAALSDINHFKVTSISATWIAIG